MNIGVPYKSQKNNVIDLFKDYLDKRGQTHDGNDIDFWKKRVEHINHGKYTITVTGEFNSGKSTFINALLGVELLPTGIRQLTSAIVELSKSERPYLKVKYADKSEKQYDNQETLKEELTSLCAIPEQYQYIPTTLIDALIQRTNDALKVNDEFISNLEKASKKNSLISHKDLIDEYLQNRKKGDIPVEINVGYPLKWDFDELRIVDSPGVNALGGVQDITYNYLKTSNAILFVHDIKRVELQSFREFAEKQITSSTRDKNTLFLILTHAGLHSNDTVKTRVESAINEYADLIPPERIIAVDSLAEIIRGQIKSGTEVEEIGQENNYKEDLIIKAQVKSAKEDLTIEDYLSKISRFDLMEKAIDNFAMEAPTLQLKEIVEMIKKGYYKLEGLYDEQIEDLTLKKKNPVEFEKSIEKKKKEIREWELILLKTGTEVDRKFRGKNVHWIKEVERLKKVYPEKINQAESLGTVRVEVSMAKDEVNDLKNSFVTSVTNFLIEKLNKESQRFKSEHKIILPEIDLDSLEKKARSQSFDTVEKKEIFEQKKDIGRRYYNLWKFWRKDEWETIVASVSVDEVFNEEKFLGNYKSALLSKFYLHVNELLQKSDEFLMLYLDDFNNMVSEIIEVRQRGYDQLINDKSNNEKLISNIEELKTKKKSFQPEYKRIDEILGDLS